MPSGDTLPVQMHASAVAVGPAGLLIVGKPGAGKSSLALQMMAMGATLVADDRVNLSARPEGGLMMSSPSRLSGLVEARGLGLIAVQYAPAVLRAVVDLDITETERVPERHETVIAGYALPLVRKVETPAFPAMLMAYLKGGRVEV